MKKDINYEVAFIVSIIGGMLGIDRFYVGDIGLGILKLFTAGGFFVWYITDIIKFNKLRIEQRIEQNKLSDEEREKRRKEELEKEEQKKRLLLSKYSPEIVARIQLKKPAIGDTFDIIKEMFGNPVKYDKEETAKTTKYTLKYYEGQKGSYKLVIELKDDLVSKITDKR
ncbi:MAG: TM2 domain-containing protein [Candidatus Kapaibacterium sp.]